MLRVTQDCNVGIGWVAFLSGGLSGEELLQTNSNCWQNSCGYMTEYPVWVFFLLAAECWLVSIHSFHHLCHIMLPKHGSHLLVRNKSQVPPTFKGITQNSEHQNVGIVEDHLRVCQPHTFEIFFPAQEPYSLSLILSI